MLKRHPNNYRDLLFLRASQLLRLNALGLMQRISKPWICGDSEEIVANFEYTQAKSVKVESWLK